MREKLVLIYDEFMKISVKGMDIEPMYKGLAMLTQLINSLPDDNMNTVNNNTEENVNE